MLEPGEVQGRVQEAIVRLPSTLRKGVQLVGTNGSVLNRITDFAQPVDSAASGLDEFSSEVLFVRVSKDMLYHMAIANKYKASSIDGEVRTGQECVGGHDSQLDSMAAYSILGVTVNITWSPRSKFEVLPQRYCPVAASMRKHKVDPPNKSGGNPRARHIKVFLQLARHAMSAI